MPAPTSPASLDDACGAEPGNFCKWVYQHTGENKALAKTADWLIGKPLGIAGVVLVAWLLQLVARHWVTRVVRRMLTPPESVVSRLESLGLGTSATEATEARRTARASSVATALSSALAVFIWVAAAIVIADIVGVQLAPLIAGAGILGVALGFGLQSLVKDCVSGMFMLLEDQYGIGDSIDVGQAAGVVEKVTLRSTVLRGADGTVWHVPNGEIRRVGNRTQLWSAALIDVDIAQEADVAVAREALQQTADAVCGREPYAPVVLEAPQVLGVEALSASGVTVRLLVKTAPGAQWALQRALREAITTALGPSRPGGSLLARAVAPAPAPPPEAAE